MLARKRGSLVDRAATPMRIRPTREDYLRLSEEFDLVPVQAELSADLETPVSAYLKVCAGRSPSFLLESVEQGDQIGRYSWLGCEPSETLIWNGEGNPWDGLAQKLNAIRVAPMPDVPFPGGVVGYWGYETIRHLEPRVPLAAVDDLPLPEAAFMLTRGVIAFDHVRRTLRIIAFAGGPDGYEQAQALIEDWAARLRAPLLAEPLELGSPTGDLAITSNRSREDYEAAVSKAQEHILAGDIFQLVLSQRLSAPYEGDAFSLYRVLRAINPSPYMFFQDWGSFQLVGSSPEVMVRLDGRKAMVRPIAGTRRRGEVPDAELAEDLLGDPKERAEHLMLVDLGRNDLGRVCVPGTVKVDELMRIERYSHVLHIVSNVHGELQPGKTGLDLLAACFPAGTVSGSPKIRAMELIATLEPTRRGPYSGAVGVLGFDGTINTGITIRTMVVADGRVHVQAGAGIVADSTPAGEYQETLSKAQALLQALQSAPPAAHAPKAAFEGA
ncbi:Anthranilate synthase component 1 [compost metagenome]